MRRTTDLFRFSAAKPEQLTIYLVGDIKERSERGGRKQTITTCPEPASILRLLCKLLQQHGFTCAGLARDEYQPALPLACLARVLMQARPAGFPARSAAFIDCATDCDSRPPTKLRSRAPEDLAGEFGRRLCSGRFHTSELYIPNVASPSLFTGLYTVSAAQARPQPQRNLGDATLALCHGRGEWGDRPLLLAVDTDARQLGRIEGELQRAFGADFRVRGELLPEDAIKTLQGARARQERVAVVLVDDSFPDEARAEILSAARTLHPNARRALLVAWGAWAHPESAQKILRGIAVGDISYYVLKPWITPDELFPPHGC